MYNIIIFIEDTMNVSDVVFEMELAGVDAADIASIITLCQRKGFNSDFIDEELLERGYPRILTMINMINMMILKMRNICQ